MRSAYRATLMKMSLKFFVLNLFANSPEAFTSPVMECSEIKVLVDSTLFVRSFSPPCDRIGTGVEKLYHGDLRAGAISAL